MKNLIVPIGLLFVVLSGYGQTGEACNSSVQNGIAMIISAKILESYITNVSYFERLASSENKKWLPQYFSAYSNLGLGIRG